MPAPLISKDEVLARLLAAFSCDGYDGASLAELSQRTGLGKSSLYHYFPGGKAEMAAAVLGHLERVLGEVFTAALACRTPAAQHARLLDGVDAFYAGGKTACILERLAASVDRTNDISDTAAQRLFIPNIAFEVIDQREQHHAIPKEFKVPPAEARRTHPAVSIKIEVPKAFVHKPTTQARSFL